MATSTKTTKRRSTSKAKSLAVPPKPSEPRKPIVPVVGTSYLIKQNKAPLWESPDFGGPDNLISIKVLTIEHLRSDGMTFRDFAENAPNNIGPYRVLAMPDDGEPIEFFWNDILVRQDMGPDDSEYDPFDIQEHEQPFARFNLRLVYTHGKYHLPTRYTAGPTMAERLALISNAAIVFHETEDETLNYVRVVPEVIA